MIAAHKNLQIDKLNQQQAAAQVKFDRMLQELERLGAERIKPLAGVIAAFDVATLKSVVFDIESALDAYNTAASELRRIGD